MSIWITTYLRMNMNIMMKLLLFQVIIVFLGQDILGILHKILAILGQLLHLQHILLQLLLQLQLLHLQDIQINLQNIPAILQQQLQLQLQLIH